MTIVNGYASLSEFKAYKSIDSTDATDDTVIEDIIEAVSRYFDLKTGRTFYARTETRYFDVPAGRELMLDDDLLTVTTLTNGDGVVIANTEYDLVPKNGAVHFAIRLKQMSAVLWQSDAYGNTESVISVAGTWGKAATVPDQVKEACLEVAANVYGRRSGQGTDGSANITAAGMVVYPRDIPGWVRDMLDTYKRRL